MISAVFFAGSILFGIGSVICYSAYYLMKDREILPIAQILLLLGCLLAALGAAICIGE